MGGNQSTFRSGGMNSSLSALHVLHMLLCRPCWQMPSPPHSLHRFLCRLCSHCPVFPPRARFPPPLLLPLSPSGAARLLLPFPFRPSAPLLPPEPQDCADKPLPCPPPLLHLLPLAGLLSARAIMLFPEPPPPSAPVSAGVAAPSAPASGLVRVSSLLPNNRGPRFRQHQRAAPRLQQPAARVLNKPACNTGLSRNRHRGEMRETATTHPCQSPEKPSPPHAAGRRDQQRRRC